MSAIKISQAEVTWLRSLIGPLRRGEVPQGINVGMIEAITRRRRHDRYLTNRDRDTFELLLGIANFFDQVYNGRLITPADAGFIAADLTRVIQMLPNPIEPEAKPRPDLLDPARASPREAPRPEPIQADLTLERACMALVSAAHRGDISSVPMQVRRMLEEAHPVFEPGSLRDLISQFRILEAGEEPFTRDLHSLATKVSIIVKQFNYETAGMPSDEAVAQWKKDFGSG
jgi:hypothetical protein